MTKIISLCVGIFAIYQVFLFFYFRSEKFRSLKASISEHINDCNELNNHIEELKRSHEGVNSQDYGVANLKDNSKYNFKRQDWGKNDRNSQTHNCSASVCKNAHDQPFKYLCKYFNIKTNEDTLIELENTLNDFSAVEQGKFLLEKQKDSILASISRSIPLIVMKFSKRKLAKKLGFYNIDLSDLYFDTYTFQYVSAGGNSSVKTEIKLDINNLDGLILYLSELVKFRKSAAGQRALMTSNLRETIKLRDNYTCKICNLSTRDEKNLLLEIDHILPISKGGMTTESNLQTLCWRCNRSKGAKIT
ncbi:HNH endonuclease [Hydromonas duriensis]|uniref:HNH endonuclease n=1 Tax=Hydromonas duriensis TaxID=1527608 RepID=A0A4V3DJS2_9BURK|nr:HNH endonuclease signature motif containing protein [Hydromonas duriensis]TDR31246.1 HNH endonuclease [Hydromonas duriensis]